jgi:hypothetical protein
MPLPCSTCGGDGVCRCDYCIAKGRDYEPCPDCPKFITGLDVIQHQANLEADNQPEREAHQGN